MIIKKTENILKERRKIMKNLKKCTLITLITTLCICLLPVQNRVYAINSTYQFNDYNTTILTASDLDDFIRIDFIENNIDITLDIDSQFRYVIVNDIPYTYEDVVSATKIQSDSIFEENINMTILDALSEFQPINDLNGYLMQNHLSDVIFEPNISNSVIPQGYGDEYYVGTYQKSNMLVSLASTAVSLLIGFWVTANFGDVSGVVSSFVSDYLIDLGVSSVITSAYYKKYQTVLNSGGTTREGRQFGLWDKVEARTIWNVDAKGNKICVYYTFESIRPGY